MSEFSDWLTKRMDELGRGGSLRAVAQRIGVSPNTVRMWKVGKSIPQPDNWAAIAQAFHEDIEVVRRLVGHADNPADNYIRRADLTAEEEEIVLAYRSASEQHRELLVHTARVVAGTRHDSDAGEAAAT